MSLTLNKDEFLKRLKSIRRTIYFDYHTLPDRLQLLLKSPHFRCNCGKLTVYQAFLKYGDNYYELIYECQNRNFTTVSVSRTDTVADNLKLFFPSDF